MAQPARLSPTTRDTTGRLIEAATMLFATRGFDGTSVRDIARRAGVNIASGHYHYGSKEQLYVEVLRNQFAEARAFFERRHAHAPKTRRRMPRREVEILLETRISAILDFLLGPPPGPHGALIMREVCDPTRALPIIVSEFITPQVKEMSALVARLAPRADPETLRLATFSIFGQILFFRFNMPILLQLAGRTQYARGFSQKLARHITAFSLSGLAHLPRSKRADR